MKEVDGLVAAGVDVPVAFPEGVGELDHDGFEGEAFGDDCQLALADGVEVFGGDGEGDAGGVGEELEGGDGGAAEDFDLYRLLEAGVEVCDLGLPLEARAEVLGVQGRCCC